MPFPGMSDLINNEQNNLEIQGSLTVNEYINSPNIIPWHLQRGNDAWGSDKTGFY